MPVSSPSIKQGGRRKKNKMGIRLGEEEEEEIYICSSRLGLIKMGVAEMHIQKERLLAETGYCGIIYIRILRQVLGE
jgi:hypothetical protein